MNKNVEILNLIKPLFDEFGYKITPSPKEHIDLFRLKIIEHKIPEKIANELVGFYKISNGIPCLDIDFHDCLNKNLYEFWGTEKSIWLGSRDSDIFRWVDNKYCIGSVNKYSYSQKHEFETLYDLLYKALNEFK